MRPARPYVSFRLKVMLPPVLLLVLLLSAVALLGSAFIAEVTVDIARTRADATARSLGASTELLQALHKEQPERIDRLLGRALEGDPYLAYVELRTPQRVHSSLRGDAEGEVLRRQADTLRALLGTIHGPVVRTVERLELVITRQRLAQPGPGPGAGDSFVAVAVSLTRQQAEYRATLWTFLSFFALAVLAYFLGMLYFLGSFTRRLEQLAHGARRIVEGDLHARLGSSIPDELGLVGRAFDGITERLARALRQLRDLAVALDRFARDVGDATQQVRRGAATQVSDSGDAAEAAREVLQALQHLVKQTETARDETRLSATISQRLATVSQEAAQSVEEAERTVGLTGDNVTQLVASIADVAERAGTLSDTSADTAGAMGEMKHSINRVRETAITAAGLAEHASMDAERGTLVLAESMAGIEHIHESSRAIGQVTDDLQRRVSEIGDVLHLITELTQRTNLLALNASIIAAQAGAEGRGFAVVADEIKDLARRTASSAGSIDSLIQAVAEGAFAARRAALAGGEAVETGASQAREASRTLTDILSRLRDWAAMAKSIAAATDEQARSSAQVTRSIQEVQGHVVEIAGKAAEQARRGEYLQRQALRLHEVVAALSGAMQEQREGSAQVADTLSRLLRTVDEMSASQRSRLADSERVRGLLEVVRRIATGHRDAVLSLERTAGELRTQAGVLVDELKSLGG